MEAQVREQKIISFSGHNIPVVLMSEGTIYISIPALCDALGIHAGAQIRRIRRTTYLKTSLRLVSVQTDGGKQQINCLHREKVVDWLDGVKTTTETMQTSIHEFKQRVLDQLQYVFPQVPKSSQIINQNMSAPTEQQAISQQSASTSVYLADTDLPVEEQEELSIPHTFPPALYTSTQDILVPDYHSDRAIREASLTRLHNWVIEANTPPHYTASNQIEVYLVPEKEHQEELPDLPAALERIKALGESTVLTARILCGLLNIRRLEGKLIKNRAPVNLKEIMIWRGFQMHTRPHGDVFSQRVVNGTYERKYKEQIYRDISLLQQFHLRGQHTIYDKSGIPHQYIIEGAYLIIGVVKDKTLWEEETVGYLVEHGPWIAAYQDWDVDNFARIDERIFKLNTQQDMLAIRLALFLTERWRQQALTNSFQEPIRMHDLLKESMVEVDNTHLTSRFAGRIEAALTKLYEHQILGAPPRCLTPIDKTKNWGKDWLLSWWSISPPFDTLEYYQRRKTLLYQHTLPPTSDIKRLKKK